MEEYARALITSDADAAAAMPLEVYLKQWVPKSIFAPGSTPAYSNYATSVAGYIVQRLSGQSFDDYIDQHIFAPLNMKHSTFRQPLPEALKGFMSNGYELASDAKPKGFEFVISAPAGSLSAAGEDMGRFMIAHLQNGAFGSNRILSEKTARHDARDRAGHDSAAEPHAARLLRNQHQWPPRDLARGRHAVVPQPAQSVSGRRHRPLLVGEQRRQGRRCPSAAHGVVSRVRRPLPAGRAEGRHRRCRNRKAARAADGRHLRELAPFRQRVRHDGQSRRADENRRHRQGQHHDPGVHRSRRTAEEMEGNRAVRVARCARQRSCSGQGRRWARRAFQHRSVFAVHGVRTGAVVALVGLVAADGHRRHVRAAADCARVADFRAGASPLRRALRAHRARCESASPGAHRRAGRACGDFRRNRPAGRDVQRLRQPFAEE